ncbi:hypothetical protein [Pseudopedobacter beijingensis]|uniref:Uncharacterized protein n=1 Tax=Pseudopedobacter beijingensis TaxID=1207056 RepID=A0ABW4IFZ1_9SPHI
MKGFILFHLILLLGIANATGQETLQTVTDRGNTTNNGISIDPVFLFKSRIKAYGGGQGFFDIYNNSNNSISLLLKRSDGATVFDIDGHSMRTYFDGKVGVGTADPETKLNVNVGAGGSNGTVGLRIGSVANYPSLEFGIENDYDGLIKTYGNDLKIYAGYWQSIGAAATENHAIYFHTSKIGSSDWSNAKMVLNHNGNLGIGTTAPQEKLSVNGKIRAKEIRVETANWPGYVFEEGYQLPDLKETEHFIRTNKHLPKL